MSPTLPLAGQAALITGAATGIGSEIARRLAADGADVLLNWGPDPGAIEELADELRGMGRRVVVHRADVRRPTENTEMVDACVSQLGRLDILVSNAATQVWAPFLEVEQGDYQRVADTLLGGPFFLIQAAARHMVDRGTGGRIVCIGSMVGNRCLPGLSPYAPLASPLWSGPRHSGASLSSPAGRSTPSRHLRSSLRQGPPP